MAEYKHQEQDLRAGLQHLAKRNQEASATPAGLIHQHQAQGDLGLLRQAWLQHQAALVAVQDLERQRLNQQQQ